MSTLARISLGRLVTPSGGGGSDRIVSPASVSLTSRSKTVSVASRSKTAVLTSRSFGVTLSASSAQKIAALTQRSFTVAIRDKKTVV